MPIAKEFGCVGHEHLTVVGDLAVDSVATAKVDPRRLR
jgi:hypothetical protein